jgi:hypothetical protein
MRASYVVLAVLLAAALPAQAEVYRWVDKDGVIHYTDQPPTKDAKPAQLPPIQTITGGLGAAAVPAPKTGPAGGQADQAGAPAGIALSILSPSPEETVRRAERTLNVAVGLQQPLPEGAGLVYYLDGNPQNSPPTQSLSYTLTNVERGSHLLAVAVVDAHNRELGRSPPVIVHMKPPTAK